MMNTQLANALAKVDRASETFVQEFSRRKGFFTIDSEVDEQVLLIRFDDLRKIVEKTQKLREEFKIAKKEAQDDSDTCGRGYDLTRGYEPTH